MNEEAVQKWINKTKDEHVIANKRTVNGSTYVIPCIIRWLPLGELIPAETRKKKNDERV